MIGQYFCLLAIIWSENSYRIIFDVFCWKIIKFSSLLWGNSSHFSLIKFIYLFLKRQPSENWNKSPAEYGLSQCSRTKFFVAYLHLFVKKFNFILQSVAVGESTTQCLRINWLMSLIQFVFSFWNCLLLEEKLHMILVKIELHFLNCLDILYIQFGEFED